MHAFLNIGIQTKTFVCMHDFPLEASFATNHHQILTV